MGGITLRAVARRAGIRRPSIYAHFDNLEDVIDAVVASTFEELARSLERDLSGYTDPAARLRALYHGNVSFGAGKPRLYQLLFSHDRQPPTPQVTKPIDTMPGAEAFALLVRGIHACIDVGHSSSTDPERDARSCGPHCTATSACWPPCPTSHGRHTAASSTNSWTALPT